jgi:Holliday junction resolvasome RuvABC endonuclease subunit
MAQLPLRILGVDPATTKSGWCILEVTSLHPLEIQIKAHGQVDGQKLLRTRKEMASLFRPQFCVLDALEEFYTQLVVEHKPDIIVSEGAFGGSHMSAFLALSLAINTLRRVSRATLNKDIVEIPPTVSKLSLTGKGNADKDLMRKAYWIVPFLFGRKSDEEISEHEIDSISHGSAYVRSHILDDIVIQPKKKKR